MTTVTIPTLETDRLRLRAPKLEDHAPFASFLSSPRAAFVGGPLTDPMVLSRVFGHAAGMWLLRGFGTFIFERKSDGVAIGHGGPWQPMPWPEPELGWCIWRDDDEGEGYVTEAMTTIHRWVFEHLGWTTAVSYIDTDNHRSAAVAKRLGAVLDPGAPCPPGEDPDGLNVYRHSRGGA